MNRSLLPLLRCPASFRPLELAEETAGTEAVITEGLLVEPVSGMRYPIRRRVPFLFLVDEDYIPILQEIVSRRLITIRAIEQAEAAAAAASQVAETSPAPSCSPSPAPEPEPEPEAPAPKACHEIQNAHADAVQKLAFVEGLEFLGNVRGKRILEVGGSTAEMAATLAEAGAEVVTIEPDYAYLIDNIRPIPEHMTLMAADGQRLPFADGTFDVVTCRATLHHVARPDLAIQEMGRVLKPGGVVAILSEPFRPFFYPEHYLTQGLVDFQEGLNEHVPAYSTYLRGLKQGGLQDYRVRVLFGHPPYALFNRLGRLRGRAQRWFETLFKLEPGELSWRSLRLRLNNGGMNLYAHKAALAVALPPPKLPHDAAQASPESLLAVDWYGPEGGVADVRRRTRNLEDRLLSLLEHRPIRSEVDLLEPLVPELVRGWHHYENYWGDDLRFTYPRADVYLRLGSGQRYLHLEVKAADVEQVEVRPVLRVVLNGTVLGEVSASGQAWTSADLPLPEGIQPGVKALSFEALELTTVTVEALVRQVGPALRWMGFVGE